MRERVGKKIILLEAQGCSYFALSGKEENDRDVHAEFQRLTDELAEPYVLYETIRAANPNSYDFKAELDLLYQYRPELRGKLKPLPPIGSSELANIRMSNMKKIVSLQDKDLVEIQGARVFVGGICTGKQIIPEHYFVEVYYGKNDPRNLTLDTFINQKSLVVIPRAVLPGEGHHPGCEAHASRPENVILVEVAGLTQGQLDLIARTERSRRVQETAWNYYQNERKKNGTLVIPDLTKPQMILERDKNRRMSVEAQQNLHNRLYDSNSNYDLVKQKLNNLKFGRNDPQMKKYLDRCEATMRDNTISSVTKKELVKSMEKVVNGLKSPVNQEIRFLVNKFKTAASKNWLTHGMEKKARRIEEAMGNVPIRDRIHLLQSKDPSVTAVLAAIAAHNRSYLNHLNPEGKIDEKISSRSFKSFKKKFNLEIAQRDDVVSDTPPPKIR